MASPREVAWQVLNRCDASEQYSNIALDIAIKRADLKDSDRGLLTALVYGTIERRITLDASIEHLAARGTKELPQEVRNLLRMGIYQMAFLDRIPDHAAVNETVALAPKKYRGFVNAILRAFVRNGKQLSYPNRDTDPMGYLSVRYSFCPEICDTFVASFGLVRTEELFAAFEKEPPLTVRVNTLQTSRAALIERWRADGLRVEETAESEHGIRVLDKIPVTALYGFEEGLFFVQDEASQLCVKVLDVSKGMRVLDACACPGSKSFGAAMDLQNTGSVTSCDLHKNKLSLVTSGAERLGITNLLVMEQDARVRREEWVGAFDRVLCDVPCSGFGVFAKKPELHYKNPAESERLPKIQADILDNASAYVKTGGKLVYSTCTLLPDENERNVAAFLERNDGFSLLEQRTLTPDRDGTDGFFYAVLIKR